MASCPSPKSWSSPRTWWAGCSPGRICQRPRWGTGRTWRLFAPPSWWRGSARPGPRPRSRCRSPPRRSCSRRTPRSCSPARRPSGWSPCCSFPLSLPKLWVANGREEAGRSPGETRSGAAGGDEEEAKWTSSVRSLLDFIKLLLASHHWRCRVFPSRFQRRMTPPNRGWADWLHMPPLNGWRSRGGAPPRGRVYTRIWLFKRLRPFVQKTVRWFCFLR